MKVMIDTNVILDVLTIREAHFRDSAMILSLVKKGELDGYIAAHAVTTLFYLGRKIRGDAVTRRFLRELLSIMRVAPVDEFILTESLALPNTDYEDAVVYACADASNVEAIITRDPKGFKALDIPILSPVEMLAIRASGMDISKTREE